VSYNIEIKSQPNWDGHLTPAVGTFCQAVLAALAEVQAHWAQLYGPDSAAHLLAQCVWIQSFDPRALRVLRTQHGFRNLVFLSERPISPAGVQRRVGFLPPVVSPYHKWVGPRTVRRFHRAGMQVVPWTVNDARRVRQLVAYGVDGIITDYPPAGIE
jgi:glycerophosphoryl diester phosphodiesterase